MFLNCVELGYTLSQYDTKNFLKQPSHLAKHGTAQDHSVRDDAALGFLQLLKYAAVKVVDDENRLIVVVNHVLKAGVRVSDSTSKILQSKKLVHTVPKIYTIHPRQFTLLHRTNLEYSKQKVMNKDCQFS